MATAKRERQKAARRAKVERQARESKRRRQTRRIIIVAVIAVIVIASGAWLFSGSSSTTTTTTMAPTTTTMPVTTTTMASASTTTTMPVTTTTTAAALGSGANPPWGPVTSPQAAGTAGKAPNVVVPSSAPPTSPQFTDLIKGTGATLKTGANFTAQYVLATYSSHKVVQSSWTSGPFSSTLDVNHLIPGWVTGLSGMKVGGRRELVLPPADGYGSNAPGNGIAANDTLIFVVDLLKVG